MTVADRDGVTELTGRLFEAAYDPAAWPAAIAALQGAFHGAAACFCIEYGRHADVVSGNCDPHYAGLYLSEMIPHNLVWRPLMGAPVGAVASDRMLMDKDDFRKTVIYNDWYAPQDYHASLSCKVSAPSGGAGFVVVNRGGRQPDFEDEDLALMRHLAPTLARVAALRQRFGALRLAERASGQVLANAGVGFALAAADGRLLHMSEAALGLLRAAGLIGRDGHLAAGGHAEAKALRKLVAEACASPPGPGGDLLVRPPGASPPRPGPAAPALAVAVSPMRDAQAYGMDVAGAAALFLRPVGFALPPGFPAMTRALFGFSAREAEIAGELAAGRSLKEAAYACGITISTARTYMARIFLKTETSQQSQVVALLRGLLPAPPSGG
ncbi:helix-turn-helix transcriptional regulator [Azorhizobium doebereinerae]|uniref:helix-turn-helix transcriptional regulator n=1 Tax=Azorhizobium doebereinerae TaxID=281091 RepID=UPI000404AADE|nr:helix-turn-helix transcriptional regulator [Azorhizobium doebereinerae]